MTAKDAISFDANTHQLICKEDWNLANLPHLQKKLKKIRLPKSGAITINGKSIKKIDSAGAWLILQFQEELEHQGMQVHLSDFSKEAMELFSLIKGKLEKKAKFHPTKKTNFFAKVGKNTIMQLLQL